MPDNGSLRVVSRPVCQLASITRGFPPHERTSPMKTAVIRKGHLPVLAASAVMGSSPAVAENCRVSLGFGGPGCSQGYGAGWRGLGYRAHGLSQRIARLGWSGGGNRRRAHDLARQMDQYQRLEYRYARDGVRPAEVR